MSDDSQQDDAQKTEEPTPKKIEDSRRKGQVALSREVNNWLMLFAGTIVIVGVGPSALRALRDFLKTYIEKAHLMPGVPGGVWRGVRRGVLADVFYFGVAFNFFDDRSILRTVLADWAVDGSRDCEAGY